MVGNLHKPAEKDIAAAVVDWLTEAGWDVYHEVIANFRGYTIGSGGRADIVAVKGPLVWVVESKTAMSLGVIEQAHAWLKVASFVSVAVPVTRNAFGFKVCQDYGIGAFVVSTQHVYYGGHKALPQVTHKVQPQLNRAAHRFLGKWKETLRDEHKTQLAAGSAGGGYFTPYKGTCMALATFVQYHKGCTLKDAIKGIKHHYASDVSAVGSLRVWIQEGKIEGVGHKMDGKKILLYPAGQVPE